MRAREKVANASSLLTPKASRSYLGFLLIKEPFRCSTVVVSS